MIKQHSNILFTNNANSPKTLAKCHQTLFLILNVLFFWTLLILVMKFYHLLLPFKLLDVQLCFLLCQHLTHNLHNRIVFLLQYSWLQNLAWDLDLPQLDVLWLVWITNSHYNHTNFSLQICRCYSNKSCIVLSQYYSLLM